VLVSIPLIVTQTALQRRRWRMWLGVAATAVLLIAIVGTSYVAAHGNERLVSMLSRGGGS
jgi:hypothetical protein